MFGRSHRHLLHHHHQSRRNLIQGSDYQLHELPAVHEEDDESTSFSSPSEPGESQSLLPQNDQSVYLDLESNQMISSSFRFWKNHGNLSIDAFLHEIYGYFMGKGFFCIILAEVMGLLTSIFVLGLMLFLFLAIDYDTLFHVPVIKDWRQVIDLSMVFYHPISYIMWSIMGLYLIFQIVGIYKRWPFLRSMQYLFNELLDISDTDDLPTITWSEVVARLMNLETQEPLFMSQNVQSPILDAHSIANRLMRQENYQIAMFNQNILDLTLKRGGAQWYTRYLQWNLSWALEKLIFDEDRQLKPEILLPENEEIFAKYLRLRFLLLGILNLVFSPVIVVYLLVYFIIHLGSELHSNYGKIAYRKYSHLARILFQEFNELPHQLAQRLNESTIYCDEYLNQFPSLSTAICAR